MVHTEDKLPLRGRSVVVTRPSQQNDFMRLHLTKLGAKPILFPCIEIAPVDSIIALRDLPVSINDVQLYIFVSSNAVKYGFSQIPGFKDQIAPDKIFAAVGESTARVLQEAGIQQVLTPENDFDSEALLSLLNINTVKNKNVLIIKGKGGRTLLYDTLIGRQANVHSLDVYQRIIPTTDPKILEKHIDIVLFTSNECVENMLKILPASLHNTVLKSQTITGHPRIAEIVSSLGFEKLPIIASNPSDAEMLAALLDWANRMEIHNEQ